MLPLFDDEYTNCSQPWHVDGVQVGTGLEPLQVCVLNVLLLSCNEYWFEGWPLHDGFAGQTCCGHCTEHSLVTPVTLSNEPSASVM
jgi:hypothetical protein